MSESRLRIAVFAPSGAVIDEAAWHRGVARLAQVGELVYVPELPARRFQRFAGDDDCRLDELHAVARLAPDLAIAARGGYGVSRLLDRIDWQLLGQSVKQGTHWLGFSDITALHMGLLARTGQPSLAGPSVCADFGALSPNSQALAQVWQHVRGTAWQTEFRVEHPRGATLPPARGVLWGGNLAMLASLVGTPYLPRIEQGIVFLEDVAEPPYRVERMLHQLLLSGVLKRQQAVLIGQFTDYRLSTHDNGYDLIAVQDYFHARGIALFNGLPFGHDTRSITLPVGREVELRIDAGQALLKYANVKMPPLSDPLENDVYE